MGSVSTEISEVRQSPRLVKNWTFFFTLRACLWLLSASLLRACNSLTMASPLNALQIKTTETCKIQVSNLKSVEIFSQGNIGMGQIQFFSNCIPVVFHCPFRYAHFF